VSEEVVVKLTAALNLPLGSLDGELIEDVGVN
jgi:hypothetical protein